MGGGGTRACKCVHVDAREHACVRRGEDVCMPVHMSTGPSPTHLCLPSGNLA